tara:strand:- start:178 stop:351 length:174 start_codon:yes stop_codon:yes gene_type:complete
VLLFFITQLITALILVHNHSYKVFKKIIISYQSWRSIRNKIDPKNRFDLDLSKKLRM